MHELEPWKISNLCFKFGPSFASAQLALALRGFLSRPTCLPPVLAGGSTVKSSSPNKSWSRILAWQTLSHSGQLSSGWGDSQSQPGLHWQGVFRNQLALSRSVSCRANMGIQEIQVEVLTSDVMAEAGGAAGPALDVQHQPEGTVRRQCRFY